MTSSAAKKNTFGLLIEGLWNAVKTTRTIVWVVLLVLSLTLNVAVIAVDAVAEIAEEVFERISGRSTTRAAEKLLLQQQVQRLGRTVAAQERTIAAGAARLRRALMDIEIRDRQMASLSKDLVRTRLSAATDLDAERATARRLVRETSQRISRRIYLDAIRNVGSSIAEAVPWIGISVIAGVTALELKDACDSMRDLYELEAAFDPDAASDADATIVCGIEVPTADELWAAVKEKTSSSWDYVGGYIPEIPELDLPFMD
jgi:hypothetical protein